MKDSKSQRHSSRGMGKNLLHRSASVPESKFATSTQKEANALHLRSCSKIKGKTSKADDLLLAIGHMRSHEPSIHTFTAMEAAEDCIKQTFRLGSQLWTKSGKDKGPSRKPKESVLGRRQISVPIHHSGNTCSPLCVVILVPHATLKTGNSLGQKITRRCCSIYSLS